MALFVKFCLVLSVLKLAHASPGLRGLAGPSIVKPLPAMAWDKEPLPGETIDGWLTAPMNPFDVEGPNVSLRVRCTFASVQPAPLGTLLVHCGGPSSGKECVDTLGVSTARVDPELLKSYNIFAIDQRGISESLPKISCDDTAAAFHLPLLGRNRTYEIQDFTSCPCSAFDGASEFMHHIPSGEDEESAILEHYKSLSRQQVMCYLSQEGKHGKYNIFQFIGTEYLAHDLERFRKAIGAEKLHLFGGSYGTQVCSVYASMFPQHTGNMIIDSNVNPVPTLKQYVEDYADNHVQMFAEMARRCHVMGASCPLQNPLEDFDAALAKLSSGFFTAPTDFGTMKLTPVMLTIQMQPMLQSPVGMTGNMSKWFQFATTIGEVLSSVDGRNFTETLLDDLCKVEIPASVAASCKDKAGKSLAQENPDSNTTVLCPTWRQYGVCLTNNNGSSIVTGVGAILAQDTPGRYLPGQYAKYHAYVLSKFGPIGAAPALTLASNAFWPARISYPGVGNAELRPLIVGVTKDPQTPFLWTQRMVQAFPNSRLMTWQGYQHIALKLLFSNLENTTSSSTGGAKPCLMSAKQYLLTGKLPENGRVCHQGHLDLVEME
jgi:pimeloyl-ACP methyl ester carboxylesterase